MGTFFYEYDLFIPVRRRRQPKRVSDVLAKARAEILNFFGGLTESKRSHKGLWKIGPVTVKDEIQVWHVLSNKASAGDRFLKKIRKNLERDLKQDLVLIIRHRVNQI